jgi:hypothetical protein
MGIDARVFASVSGRAHWVSDAECRAISRALYDDDSKLRLIEPLTEEHLRRSHVRLEAEWLGKPVFYQDVGMSIVGEVDEQFICADLAKDYHRYFDIDAQGREGGWLRVRYLIRQLQRGQPDWKVWYGSDFPTLFPVRPMTSARLHAIDAAYCQCIRSEERHEDPARQRARRLKALESAVAGKVGAAYDLAYGFVGDPTDCWLFGFITRREEEAGARRWDQHSTSDFWYERAGRHPEHPDREIDAIRRAIG